MARKVGGFSAEAGVHRSEEGAYVVGDATLEGGRGSGAARRRKTALTSLGESLRASHSGRRSGAAGGRAFRPRRCSRAWPTSSREGFALAAGSLQRSSHGNRPISNGGRAHQGGGIERA